MTIFIKVIKHNNHKFKILVIFKINLSIIKQYKKSKFRKMKNFKIKIQNRLHFNKYKNPLKIKIQKIKKIYYNYPKQKIILKIKLKI